VAGYWFAECRSPVLYIPEGCRARHPGMAERREVQSGKAALSTFVPDFPAIITVIVEQGLTKGLMDAARPGAND
jgi:hypothetical protein